MTEDKEYISLDVPSCYVEQEDPCISFQIQDKEFLKLDKKGISLNRENFPDWKPDEFVPAFIEIMERNYRVKFEKVYRVD